MERLLFFDRKTKMSKKEKSKKRHRKKKATLKLKWLGFWQQKAPILRFVGLFFFGIVLFYSLYFSDFFMHNVADSFNQFIGEIASFALNIFQQNTGVQNGIISSGDAAVNVKKGCDGLESIAFFTIGVLLVPFSWRSRLVGLAVGVSVLFLLNIFRIIILYFSQIYFPTLFDFLHIHGGFILFIFVTLLIWMRWVQWAMSQEKIQQL